MYTYIQFNSVQFSSVQFSRSVMCDSLRHHGLQHARPPCPSTTPGVDSNSCPLSWWHHPTDSSSVIPFNLITWTTASSNSKKLWAMPCRATQDRRVMVESSDKMWSTGEGNGKPLQYSFMENLMNSMKMEEIRGQLLWTHILNHCSCPQPYLTPTFQTQVPLLPASAWSLSPSLLGFFH